MAPLLSCLISGSLEHRSQDWTIQLSDSVCRKSDQFYDETAPPHTHPYGIQQCLITSVLQPQVAFFPSAQHRELAAVGGKILLLLQGLKVMKHACYIRQRTTYIPRLCKRTVAAPEIEPGISVTQSTGLGILLSLAEASGPSLCSCGQAFSIGMIFRWKFFFLKYKFSLGITILPKKKSKQVFPNCWFWKALQSFFFFLFSLFSSQLTEKFHFSYLRGKFLSKHLIMGKKDPHFCFLIPAQEQEAFAPQPQ